MVLSASSSLTGLKCRFPGCSSLYNQSHCILFFCSLSQSESGLSLIGKSDKKNQLNNPAADVEYYLPSLVGTDNLVITKWVFSFRVLLRDREKADIEQA